MRDRRELKFVLYLHLVQVQPAASPLDEGRRKGRGVSEPRAVFYVYSPSNLRRNYGGGGGARRGPNSDNTDREGDPSPLLEEVKISPHMNFFLLDR